MKILVKVKTGSAKDEVQKLEDGSFLVYIKIQPEKGKANKTLICALGKHFDIPQSSIQIISGHTSKNKIIDVG